MIPSCKCVTRYLYWNAHELSYPETLHLYTIILGDSGEAYQ